MIDELLIPKIDSLAYYNIKHPLLVLFSKLIKAYTEYTDPDPEAFNRQYRQLYFDLKQSMFDYAYAKDEVNHFAKTPWQDFIISQIISEENPLTLFFERQILNPSHPYYNSMKKDIRIMTELYHFDWELFLLETELDENNIFSSRVFFPIAPFDTIAYAMDTKDIDRIFEQINLEIKQNGLGVFETNTFFTFDAATDRIIPVKSTAFPELSKLIGYDQQKEALIANTTDFVEHFSGVNVLLQGPAGTGKSSMIKALSNDFKNTKCRMIELKRDEIEKLPDVIDAIEDRPYAFIIFIDGLVFSKTINDFKLLKQVLANTSRQTPKNILIYATTDQRHIVNDKLFDETSESTEDSMQSQFSGKFDLILTFDPPTQKEYLAIVKQLAGKEGIEIEPARLETKAIQWELQHLNRSGKTAASFVAHLKNV